MSGIVAGIGVKAALGGALGGLGKFIRSIPWQVWLALAVAGLIAFLAISRSHWIGRAHADEAQLARVCTATRTAAANPKLDCKKVEAQIRELGNSIAALKGALASQNAAINAVAAKTAEQQKLAAEAAKRAARRAEGIQAVGQRLTESSRHRPPPGAPCVPSKVLKEQWQ